MIRLAILAALMICLPAAVSTTAAETAHPVPSSTTAHDFSFKMPEGEPLRLSDYAGKLVLLVNTATACGFSGQLGALQTLADSYGDRGLVVIGVPSNDFGGQEPRKDSDIAGYCEAAYGATFPMTAKTHVKGDDAHPFYVWAADALDVTARPLWNFHKYLIGPDGKLVAWFATPTPPMSDDVTSEIERRLQDLPKS
ncbi:glutathione peroxidase [Rhodobacterales bacterium]|nr:glutathione peroxidase [Rhodobacterales bacterium]